MKNQSLTFEDVKEEGAVKSVKVFWGASHIGNIHQSGISEDWFYKAHGAGKGPFREYPSIQDVKISLMG